MSACLCLVVSGKLKKPSRVYYPEAGVMFPPDVLVTCVVSADRRGEAACNRPGDQHTGDERTPRTEQRTGATNDPPPSVSSGHRASTDCYLNTEHSIGHCVREIINNRSFENIESDARGRRGWELRPLEWWQGSLRGVEPGTFEFMLCLGFLCLSK